MRILIISQVFWPDTSSVAQHLWDLSEVLTLNGNKVSVLSSIFPYENKQVKYVKREIHNDILINRIKHTGFGKSSTVGRLVDFFTFNIITLFNLLSIKRDNYDLIIGTTVPPLLSYIGVIVAKRKKIPFYYWAMDMQPELSISSNLIRKDSLAAGLLSYLGNYIIKNSSLIFALDGYMKEHLIKKGALDENVSVMPVWPVMDKVYSGSRIDNPFRLANGFNDKIVIMYSGNHALVHPLDTLLGAAKVLKNDNRFIFVFIGGGLREKDVTNFKKAFQLENIIQLPYQPRNNIHNSLASADIQVVIMGNNQVGFTHPNKVYGALFIGKPILYIGPSPSHVSDILNKLQDNISVEHGEIDRLCKELLKFSAFQNSFIENIGKRNQIFANMHYQPSALKNKMVSIIESKNKKS